MVERLHLIADRYAFDWRPIDKRPSRETLIGNDQIRPRCLSQAVAKRVDHGDLDEFARLRNAGRYLARCYPHLPELGKRLFQDLPPVYKDDRPVLPRAGSLCDRSEGQRFAAAGW